jgi:predicted DNA-binding transcriptional regulator AlpA
MKGTADMLGISRHTLRRIMKNDPTFPRFIELSPGIRMVRVRNIKAWLRKKEVESLKNI